MRFLSLIFLFCCCSALENANELLMICKPASSVFAIQQTNSTNQHGCSSSSRPGKQGPPGIRGPPGAIGPSAPVNKQLNATLQSVHNQLQAIQKKLRCIDGIVVGNTCYKLIYRVGVSVNYERARSLCAFHGGGLAEIPTEEVYNAVYDYVKTNWYFTLNQETSNHVQIWLGSSYDGSGNVILTSGRQGFVRWYRTYPSSDATHTHMLIEIVIKPEQRSSGMFNHSPDPNNACRVCQPLCQFETE